MATVETNDKITVMKYNNIDSIDIQIDNGEVYCELADDDVRYLSRLLIKWIHDTQKVSVCANCGGRCDYC